MSVLLYGCTTQTAWEKNRSDAMMPHAVLNKSWKQLPKKIAAVWSLNSYLIKVRWARHVGHCWWSKIKLISSILLQTPTHGHTSIDQPAKLISSALCRHWVPSRQLANKYRWEEKESRESVLSAHLDDEDLMEAKNMIQTDKKICTVTANYQVFCWTFVIEWHTPQSGLIAIKSRQLEKIINIIWLEQEGSEDMQNIRINHWKLFAWIVIHFNGIHISKN